MTVLDVMGIGQHNSGKVRAGGDVAVVVGRRRNGIRDGGGKAGGSEGNDAEGRNDAGTGEPKSRHDVEKLS